MLSGQTGPRISAAVRSIDARETLGSRSAAGPAFKGSFYPGSRAYAVQRERIRQNAIASGLPATPGEDLKYRGGRTIRDLKYVTVYLGGENGFASGERRQIDVALEGAMTDPHLNHVLMQYFNDQPITAEFVNSYSLTGFQPSYVTTSTLHDVVRVLHSKGSFNGWPLEQTVVMFILPRGVILADPTSGPEYRRRLSPSIPVEDEATSEDGLGGYHGSVHLGQQTVYYAVAVYSERTTNGRSNGIPAFDQNWKNIVATCYHELQEARTDCDVDDAISTGRQQYLGWTSEKGEEVGDFPVDEARQLSLVFREVPLADGTGPVPIQLIYSNAVHGPEGPIATPHRGSPLPPARRRLNPNGSSGTGPVNPPQPPPRPRPSPGQPDPTLQWIESEWDHLPERVKQQVLHLIEDSTNEFPPQ